MNVEQNNNYDNQTENLVNIEKNEWRYDEDQLKFNKENFNKITDKLENIDLDTKKTMENIISDKINQLNEEIKSTINLWILDRWDIDMSKKQELKFITNIRNELNKAITEYIINYNKEFDINLDSKESEEARNRADIAFDKINNMEINKSTVLSFIDKVKEKHVQKINNNINPIWEIMNYNKKMEDSKKDFMDWPGRVNF